MILGFGCFLIYIIMLVNDKKKNKFVKIEILDLFNIVRNGEKKLFLCKKKYLMFYFSFGILKNICRLFYSYFCFEFI